MAEVTFELADVPLLIAEHHQLSITKALAGFQSAKVFGASFDIAEHVDGVVTISDYSSEEATILEKAVLVNTFTHTTTGYNSVHNSEATLFDASAKAKAVGLLHESQPLQVKAGLHLKQLFVARRSALPTKEDLRLDDPKISSFATNIGMVTESLVSRMMEGAIEKPEELVDKELATLTDSSRRLEAQVRDATSEGLLAVHGLASGILADTLAKALERGSSVGRIQAFVNYVT